MSGFVFIHRALLDHPSFRGPPEAMAFAWMIARAQWRATTVRYRGQQIDLERGQLALSVRDFAEAWEWSRGRTQRFIERLRAETMIETVVGTASLVITICNYEKYQDKPKGRGTVKEPTRGTPVGQAWDTSGTKNNKGNEGNEEKGDANASPRRASRLPDDWAPGPLTPTAQKLVEQWPQGRLERELEGFKDYWLTRTRDAARADWDATWRNRIRDQHDRIMRENCNGNGHHPAGRQSNWLAALNAERNSKRAAE